MDAKMHGMILEKITAERERQELRHPDRKNTTAEWGEILIEELGEAASCRLNREYSEAVTEMIQAAAVIVAWIEDYVHETAELEHTRE